MLRAVSLLGRGGSAAVASALRVLALFTLVNLALETWVLGAPRTWVWVDLGWMPLPVAAGWSLLFALSVLAWPQLASRWPRSRLLARAIVASAAALCATDAMRFYGALSRGDLATPVPVPLSLVVALLAGVWAAQPPARGSETAASARGPWFSLARTARTARTLALDLVTFAVGLLALCAAHGCTDHRRPADAIVVYGAGVRADGTPSNSLRDRTATGCELWRAGLARWLVLSGGSAEGAPLSEPQCMQRLARELGVPESAIVLDESGVNTLATVRTCARLSRERAWGSFLMVSHDYHLARIELLAQRAGVRAFTVPAREARPPEKNAQHYARELVALVVYWLRPRADG